MRNLKLYVGKMLMVFAVVMLCLTSVTALADETLPDGVKQVWTSVEGNIQYYVKPGDKVKKGTPLFYIVSSDNNPALFFQLEHKINYYRILYLRRMKLIKTHAVSQEDVDRSLQDLINAKDDLGSFICRVKEGYYVAPFDCEVTKLLYLNESGIGDGNPAINIKPTDKNYTFQPIKPNSKLLEVMKRSEEVIKLEAKEFNFDKFLVQK